MLLSEDSSVGISFHKTLVRTAVQAYWITFLSSKGNSNRDLHENRFIIIGTREIVDV